MAEEESVRALTQLGFTQLEAEVYTCLLKESPATGYRVAQLLGRPVAGIYKTIESLVNKGAVIVDDAENRLCRPTPPEELLRGLERTFRERRGSAAQALAELRGGTDDDRVYQLRTTEQVLERARAMLERCRSVAAVDAFPVSLERIRGDIDALIRRGRKVAVLAYEPVEIPGARVSLFPSTHSLVASFPGQWLMLTVDSQELLIAFLSRQGGDVLQAIWSGSPYLAWVLQGYMISEAELVCLMNDPELPEAAKEIARRHGRYLPPPTSIPGYREILSRLGIAPSDEAFPSHNESGG